MLRNRQSKQRVAESSGTLWTLKRYDMNEMFYISFSPCFILLGYFSEFIHTDPALYRSVTYSCSACSTLVTATMSLVDKIVYTAGRNCQQMV